MINGIPVIDAVIHPYNLDDSNLAHKNAPRMAAAFSFAVTQMAPPGYRIPASSFQRDWTIEETASVAFVESPTDLAAYHVLPLFAYADGLCSLEKGLEAQERWPDRFVFYAGVDPMAPDAIERLEEQVEALGGPVGLKLYPNSYLADEIKGWYMDDPEIAFPVFRRAQELGIRVVAVHKALPLGGVEMAAYGVSDVDRAAIAFPQLNFEVVHGGMSFLEETAWQIERFPNVWVNLETTTLLIKQRPGMFEEALGRMAGLLSSSGLKKVFWGTGCIGAHPRPLLEAFVNDFQFSSRRVEEWGTPQITLEDKRDILSGNYARMIGLDVEARLEGIKDDQFSRQLEELGGLADPYSTTRSAGHVS